MAGGLGGGERHPVAGAGGRRRTLKAERMPEPTLLPGIGPRLAVHGDIRLIEDVCICRGGCHVLVPRELLVGRDGNLATWEEIGS
jgi:hypothetical protein